MLDFSKINLEVIDVNISATPDMYVNGNCITFSKRVLEDMNYPQNVQYCVDKPHKVFALRPCKGNEAKAVQFSKPKADMTSKLTTSNKNLHDSISVYIKDYNPSIRYKVAGQYDPESRIMYFEMETAEPCEFKARRK